MDQANQDSPVGTTDPSSTAITSIHDGRCLGEQRQSRNENEHSQKTSGSQQGHFQEIQSIDPTALRNNSAADAIQVSTLQTMSIDDGDSSSEKPVSQEDLLRAIHDKLPSAEMLSSLTQHQLEVLNTIANRLKHLEETKVEFLWSSVLQLAGLLFVVIFGVFAALAYDAAEVANKQSAEANQMSFLTFCMPSMFPISCQNIQGEAKITKDISGELCVAVSQQGPGSLTSLATAVLGPTVTLSMTLTSSSPPTATTGSSPPVTTSSHSPTLTPTVTSTPSQTPSPLGSKHRINTPALVGSIVGVILGLLSVMVSSYAFFVRFRRPRLISRGSSPVEYDRSREVRKLRSSEMP